MAISIFVQDGPSTTCVVSLLSILIFCFSCCLRGRRDREAFTIVVVVIVVVVAVVIVVVVVVVVVVIVLKLG